MVALQSYGSLFFATGPVLEAQLPSPDGTSRNSVVILRLRGRTDLGTTVMDVLRRYAQALNAHHSKLIIVWIFPSHPCWGDATRCRGWSDFDQE